ncbi:MAG: YeiH family protein [Jaaginema sp. PMC 1079.18]|nr:YeiH family protein [Jaaginema sp. PMC 1080.18]MEC4851214.1 YeiH family protein [Jaaginema sp. PMC 1079.18]MEC4865681.1 YeiH family protein [Jaaginema sp. PMC 1078.18]
MNLQILKYPIDRSLAILPGLLLLSAIAFFSLQVYHRTTIHFLNPLLIAALLGILVGNTVTVSRFYQPGIVFSMKRILKISVVLLGLKLSFTEILEIGASNLILIVLSSMSTFFLTCWLGKILKINRKLTQLIAAGTSICGASAIVATNSVVDSSEEDITYAIALITGLGTMAMISYPLIPHLLQLSPQAFGVWCGVSIHEVAQVVAAAFQNNTVSGELATVTKLSRVLLLIPVILMLSFSYRNSPTKGEISKVFDAIPWFVLFFGLLTLLNTFKLIPTEIQTSILNGNQFLLCIAMAAMGLKTRFHNLHQIGLKPLYLAIFSWLFLALTSLVYIKTFLVF